MIGGIDPTACGADMLHAFASVGTRRFDVTWTNADGDKQQFRRAVPLGQLQDALPAILKRAERQGRNLIIRPNPPPLLVQGPPVAAEPKVRFR